MSSGAFHHRDTEITERKIGLFNRRQTPAAAYDPNFLKGDVEIRRRLRDDTPALRTTLFFISISPPHSHIPF
jgi:hypothetical protein